MNEPVRVLMVTGVLDRGGVETMIMNLYRHIDRSKIQFDFVEHSLIPGAYDSEIIALGGRIFHRERLSAFNYFEYVKWWDTFFIRHPEYRVVHGHIESMSSVYLSIAKKHHLYTIAHSHSTSRRGGVKQLIFDAVTYKTRYIADSLFACSYQSGKDFFGKMFDINKINCTVFYNAVDIDDFSYKESYRNQTRKELGIDDNTLLIGHIGRFRKEKNHVFLIEIYKKIIREDKNAKMVFVGDGPLYEKIHNNILSEGLDGQILLIGARDDVNKILSAIDVLVLPSFREGLPVTVIEAQAAGLPSIISDQVPKDCIVFDDLIQILSLADGPEKWADAILKTNSKNRNIDKQKLADRGFDVSSSAKWIEEFYLEKSK